MIKAIKNTDLFCDYYENWIKVYKEGAVREITLQKYKMTLSWIRKIVPTLQLTNMNRIVYQQILNEYALYHERQTTMDFHHQLKGAILDAVDEGLIERDPTRKAIIKGINLIVVFTPSSAPFIKSLNISFFSFIPQINTTIIIIGTK